MLACCQQQQHLGQLLCIKQLTAAPAAAGEVSLQLWAHGKTGRQFVSAGPAGVQAAYPCIQSYSYLENAVV